MFGLNKNDLGQKSFFKYQVSVRRNIGPLVIPVR